VCECVCFLLALAFVLLHTCSICSRWPVAGVMLLVDRAMPPVDIALFKMKGGRLGVWMQ
jgi:hypothetical protein